MRRTLTVLSRQGRINKNRLYPETFSLGIRCFLLWKCRVIDTANGPINYLCVKYEDLVVVKACFVSLSPSVSQSLLVCPSLSLSFSLPISQFNLLYWHDVTLYILPKLTLYIQNININNNDNQYCQRDNSNNNNQGSK